MSEPAFRGLLLDVNIGHKFDTLLQRHLEGPLWGMIWKSLGLSTFSLSSFGLHDRTRDDVVWQTAQSQSLVLAGTVVPRIESTLGAGSTFILRLPGARVGRDA